MIEHDHICQYPNMLHAEKASKAICSALQKNSHRGFFLFEIMMPKKLTEQIKKQANLSDACASNMQASTPVDDIDEQELLP